LFFRFWFRNRFLLVVDAFSSFSEFLFVCFVCVCVL